MNKMPFAQQPAKDIVEKWNSGYAMTTIEERTKGKYRTTLFPSPDGHALFHTFESVEASPDKERDQRIRDLFCNLTGLAYASEGEATGKYFPAGDLPGPEKFFGKGAEIFVDGTGVDGTGRPATNFPYNAPLNDEQGLIATVSRAAKPLAALDRTAPAEGATGGKYSDNPAVGRDKIAEVKLALGNFSGVEIEYNLPGVFSELKGADISQVMLSVSQVYRSIVGSRKD